jgi:hypothetical protein
MAFNNPPLKKLFPKGGIKKRKNKKEYPGQKHWVLRAI